MDFYEVFLLILDARKKLKKSADKLSLFLSALPYLAVSGNSVKKPVEGDCIPVKVWTVLKVWTFF